MTPNRSIERRHGQAGVCLIDGCSRREAVGLQRALSGPWQHYREAAVQPLPAA